MAQIVVDGGIFVTLLLGEEMADLADNFISLAMTRNIVLAAPVLLQYEIVSSIRKAVYRKRITAEQALDIQTSGLDFGVRYFLDDLLLTRAQEIAAALNMPTAYDAQYLAVGERLGAPVWTADRKFAAAAASHGVRWLGDFTPDAFPE